MKEPATARPSTDQGFSLIELLIVVAIIAIMAAISLPMIAGYLRIYKIRGASQEVAKEIQAVRGRAISKNANFGMVFLVVNSTSYRWVAEDDQDSQDTTFTPNARIPLVDALPDPIGDPPAGTQYGALQFLPGGIEFSQACAETPTGGTWESGMRFNRLGAWCRPSTGEPCPAIDPGADFVWTNPTGTGAVICLRQPATGLTRTVAVSTGGRVQTQQ
jgi:prepilin-type N-terminal cleavage/methylation domain-containing protein